MKMRALIAVSLFLSIASADAQPSGVDLRPSGRWTQAEVGSAPTPPMGWNSWNAFGVELSEAKILGSAQAIHDSGLEAQGYRSVNIDDGWWLRRRLSDGRMQVRTNLFPSAAVGGSEGTSLRPFTDHLHAMGFKAGIYTDIGRNACSQAWSPDNPNLPEGSQAEREVGLHDHVAQDIALYFGAWNFDYIKVDACGIAHYGAVQPVVASGRYRQFKPLIHETNLGQTDIPAVRRLYGEVRDALRRVRPSGDFVLSLCNWGSANVRSWGKDVGTMWRTSNDIDASWGRLLHNFDSVATRELYAGPGHWNDPDMLEVGNGLFGAGHLVEARAQMGLWAIEAAPLIIGTDVTKAPPAILDVLGAPEVIAIDQDTAGNQGVIAYADDEREIIVKSLSERGLKAVVLFNRTLEPTDITLTSAHLKLSGPIALRDLWQRRDLPGMTNSAVFHLSAHETIMLKAKGTPLLASGAYLSEMTGRIHVAADGIREPEPDPIIHRMMDPFAGNTSSGGHRPSYAGWGAPRADATPYEQSLTINGESFRYGLGVLANSRLEVRANGQFHRFVARVGVDDSTRGRHATVRFELYGDGRLLAMSRPARFGGVAQNISARTDGVRVIELIAWQSGTDDGPVVATWGSAHFE
jgi:hypothetical protein